MNVSVREMWVYVCEQMWKHTSLCRLIGFPIYQQLCHNPTYLPPRDPKADLPSPITSLPNVQLSAYGPRTLISQWCDERTSP